MANEKIVNHPKVYTKVNGKMTKLTKGSTVKIDPKSKGRLSAFVVGVEGETIDLTEQDGKAGAKSA